MTTPARPRYVRHDVRRGTHWIALDRPKRGNALVPDLLADLADAVATASGAGGPLVISGRGKAFSTGGDIAGFLDHAGDGERLHAYAAGLVGALNDAILALRRHPGTVIAAVNGPVTGGSLGLALAADRILVSRTAFVQPYYAAMGFAPDGGWTALLPARIGPARAAGWIAADIRMEADRLRRIGLADRLCEPIELIAAAEAEADAARTLDPAVILDARRLTGFGADALAPGLEAERQAFLANIARPETLARMRAFITPKTEAGQCAS